MKFIGSFVRNLFTSEENGYSANIFKINNCLEVTELKDKNIITVVGYNLPQNTFCAYELTGTLKSHPKYDVQFVCNEFVESIGKNRKDVVNYLSCGMFKGIGEKTAGVIYDTFGENCVDLIFDNPNILLKVKGIAKNRLSGIVSCLDVQQANKDLICYFQKYELPVKLCKQVINIYGEKAYKVISQNPFILCEESNVDFIKVNKIALAENICLTSIARLKNAIFYSLKRLCWNGGHVCIPLDELIEYCIELLNKGVSSENCFNEEDIKIKLRELCKSKQIAVKTINQKCIVYDSNLCKAETELAQIVFTKAMSTDENVVLIEETILEAQRELSIEFNKLQKEAIIMALSNDFSIVTGSAGTGKTTVQKGILYVLHKLFPDKAVSLCAPSGRAARRMGEVTDEDAYTIHSLLNIQPDNEDEAQIVESDMILIDEMSMTGLKLFYTLMKNTLRKTKVVLFGDYNQLMSVDAGTVLEDLLQCSFISHVHLSEIYRQAENSTILKNANLIVSDNKNKNLIFDETFDFVEKNALDSQGALQDICQKYIEAIATYGFDEVQILSPYREKGLLSAKSINQAVQKLINPNSVGIKVNGVFISRGDRVINQKNTQSAKNGDIGVVKEIATVEGVKVAFIEWQGIAKIEKYDKDTLSENNVTLAYCITIHKSQGSEYKQIIMPVVSEHFNMLKRNLFYTAITRAKSQIVLIGEKKMIVKAISDDTVEKRNSFLAGRIMSLYKLDRKAENFKKVNCNEKQNSENCGQITLLDHKVAV